MLRDIFTEEKLQQQAALLQRKFSTGFDGMDAKAAAIWISINGKKLINEIISGRYVPQPALGFHIAKKDGHFRQLSKLTAIDTIIQNCILDAISNICEAKFSAHSFAYRPGLGIKDALKQFCLYGSQYRYVAKLDPRACFDSIPHEKLFSALNAFLGEKYRGVISLIMKYAAMPLFIEGKIDPRICGILQGAPLSPLLCNIFLSQMDVMLEEMDVPFLRYADDLAVFAQSTDELNAITDRVREKYNEIGLSLNERKCGVSSPKSMVYLGHRFRMDSKGFIITAADDSARGTYYTWHQSQIRNTHRTIDLLSDGILRKSDFSLLFETSEHSTSIPQNATDCINIYSSVIFDSGFLERALESRIYINVFDKHGDLIGRFLPNTALHAPLLTYTQLQQYHNSAERLSLAAQFVLASLHNCVLNIRYHHKQKPDPHYVEALNRIADLKKKIRICTALDGLLMLEAQVRNAYYSCFDRFIANSAFRFVKRSRRPPLNEVNAMISFGNTVLYNQFANHINRTALDIRIGFLHAASAAREESLNLDIAEIFKPLIIDRAIFALINRRAIAEHHFTRENNGGVYLTGEGKSIFLRAIYAKLDEQITVQDRTYTYNMLLDEEVRKLLRHLRSGEAYKAYRQVR